MQPEFITYQKFNDPALANELGEQLQKHGVAYRINEISSGFDPSMVMSNAAIDYEVKIRSEDFEIVNSFLKEEEEKNIDAIDRDYYLFNFSNDELMEVLIKADEWNAFDVVLSRKLLTKRGEVINDDTIAAIQKKKGLTN